MMGYLIIKSPGTKMKFHGTSHFLYNSQNNYELYRVSGHAGCLCLTFKPDDNLPWRLKEAGAYWIKYYPRGGEFWFIGARQAGNSVIVFICGRPDSSHRNYFTYVYYTKAGAGIDERLIHEVGNEIREKEKDIDLSQPLECLTQKGFTNGGSKIIGSDCYSITFMDEEM